MTLSMKFLVKQTSNTSLKIDGMSFNKSTVTVKALVTTYRAITFENDISRSPMDYTWNNLSMATQQYLGKYCLAPQQPAIFDGQHGLT